LDVAVDRVVAGVSVKDKAKDEEEVRAIQTGGWEKVLEKIK
jgi:hypothetical protein